jgi:D-glycero-alpha-D-manno-heptose-7-phosphate kinase
VHAVHAQAPVRIDLAGGTLDVAPVDLALGTPVVTLNVALDLPVEVRLEPRADEAVVLRSHDLGREERHAERAALGSALASGTCALPLAGLAVWASGVRGGLGLETRAAPPPGSGLGTSSALLVALLGALRHARGEACEAARIRALAQDVETRLLGMPTGYQDYFPPLLGGCLAVHRDVGVLRAEPLPVDLPALAARLRLVYTGQPHASGLTNWGVVRAFLDGRRRTVQALHEIACQAREAREALRAGDHPRAFGHLLAEGRARARMADGVSTPAIEALDAAVRAAGALGTRICGAGGGGCVLVLLPDPQAGAAVDRVLADGPWQPLPVRLAAQGLRLEAP